MSSRNLKKLYGQKDELLINHNRLIKNEKDNNLSGSESDSLKGASSSGASQTKSGTSKGKKLAMNRFELLNNIEHNSMSDTEAKEDDGDVDDIILHETSTLSTLPEPLCLPGDPLSCINQLSQGRSRLEKQDSTQSTDSMKRKRRKKKKMRSQKSLEGMLDDHDDPEDEVEASVQEVNRILGNMTIKHEREKHKERDKDKEKARELKTKSNLLYVEHRHLNPENEMKRIFGSKVIQAELGHARRRGRGRMSGRSWVLVNPKNWQSVSKSGISMELIKHENDLHYFTLNHSKSYQAVQFQFLDAVESFNPDNLVAILNMHAYHIDTLIQFSDVSRMGEDHQVAAELIERALYCIEHAFHPLFNVTQGNCRLDYRRPENRSFFIALFKHLSFVGQRGANRTALEFCKLLLGLDPEGDPLSVLLMIDYWALRSEQYDYLIQLYEEWDPIKKLSLLPNFRYSVPLAYYLKSRSQTHLNSNSISTSNQNQNCSSTAVALIANHSSDELLNRADALLQEALILFPGLLTPLLDKLSIEPDSQVTKCAYFGFSSQQVPQAISQLISLYIGRCHLIWKDRDIMSWLERNTKIVIERVATKDKFVGVCAERRKKYFSHGTPRNVLRHVILSGIKEATSELPPDISGSPIFAFDPLPPTDSITSYTRPERSLAQRTSSSNDPNDDRSFLSMFLRSWLPDFNAEDLARNRAGAVGGRAIPAAHEAAIEGAAAGVAQAQERGDTNDLRRSVSSLLDAMRDLLSNIHMADIPNEGDAESDDEDDDENDFDNHGHDHDLNHNNEGHNT